MESPDNPEVVPESGFAADEFKNRFTDEGKEEQQPTATDAQQTDYWPEYCNPNYVMPDRIEVKVTMPGNESYFFPVTIVKSSNTKRFFGGYRNKLTGQVYHHASSQTPTDQNRATRDYTNLRTRETQTYELRTLAIQSHRESGTQMERIDLRLDSKRDREKTPKKYFTSDELLIKKKACSIIIQRCWRGCMARQLADQIRGRNVEFAQEIDRKLHDEAERQKLTRMQDMARRVQPRSNADFAVLYNELDTWRKAEVAKIKASVSDPEARKEAMSELLNNEVKALQSLQQLKLDARKQVSESKTKQMLEAMAKPRAWQLSHGEVAQVQTVETQRAKALLELCTALQATDTNVEQRLDVLLSVKWTANEFDTALTREIKDLVDREADLLNRGRPMQSMHKLRDRLDAAFLQFLEDPAYNPGAQDFVGVEPRRKQHKDEK